MTKKFVALVVYEGARLCHKGGVTKKKKMRNEIGLRRRRREIFCGNKHHTRERAEGRENPHV